MMITEENIAYIREQVATVMGKLDWTVGLLVELDEARRYINKLEKTLAQVICQGGQIIVELDENTREDRWNMLIDRKVEKRILRMVENEK